MPLAQQDYAASYKTLQRWFEAYTGLLSENRIESLFPDQLSGLFIKILSSEYSQANTNYVYEIIKSILNKTSIQEYKNNIPLNNFLHATVSFLATNTLSYLY